MLVVVLVLENPDVSQSEQVNKIIAGLSGSFRNAIQSHFASPPIHFQFTFL